MTTIETHNKEDKTTIHSDENENKIRSQKTKADHIEAAEKHYLSAAKHHEAGDHAKAVQSTIAAQRHLALANEAE